MSARPSVRMEQLGFPHWTDFHEIWYSRIFFFWKSVEKFKFNYNLTRITGTVHKDLCAFMTAKS
jgi:hypothetical protein